MISFGKLPASPGWGGPVFRRTGGLPLFLLDLHPDASAAYSLGVLSQDWLGEPVVRARRSSDNAEADFTAAQVSGGALAAWAGSGDAFATVWYDQSGNDLNAVQTTAARQPYLVRAGVLSTLAGRPAIDTVDNAARRGFGIPDNDLFRNRANFFGHFVVAYDATIEPDRRAVLYATKQVGGATTRIEAGLGGLTQIAGEVAVNGRRLDGDSFSWNGSGVAPTESVAYAQSWAANHAANRVLCLFNDSLVIDTSFQGSGLSSDTASQRVTIGLGSSTDVRPNFRLSAFVVYVGAFDQTDWTAAHRRLLDDYIS